MGRSRPAMDASHAVTAMQEPAGRARKGAQQSELQLGATSDRGRFQDVAPTLHDGADLDIPTYIRRGVRIPT